MRLSVFALAAALTSCREQPAIDTSPVPSIASAAAGLATSASSAAPAPAASPAASPVAAPASTASARATAGSVAAGPTSAGPAGSASAAPLAGAEECVVRKGPLRLSMSGPALLWPADGVTRNDFRVIFNREGAATILAPAFPQLTAPRPGRPPTAGSASAAPAPDAAPKRASWSACAVADRFVFCMDPSGSIRRATLSGEGDAPLAWGRRGSEIAATTLPGGHTALAFLGDRKTTEGVVTQAFIALDDNAAMLFSEEGSGATFITLVPWRDGALAVYIDARAALTPVHARTISIGEGGRLALGQDAVIFVGGGGEARMTGALAAGAAGPLFVLVPTTHDVSGFGMAAVRIDHPPKDDAPVTWSMYPNGLTPAPIAATHGIDPVRVARVRPASSEPDARKVLELGRLSAGGAFQPACQVAESSSFSHVAVDVDQGGALWLVYTSAKGTFVEQRGGRRP